MKLNTFKNTDQEEIPLRFLYKKMEQTEHGQRLQVSPRWSRFKEENTSLDEWVRLIGRNGNNLEHMLFIYNRTKLAIKSVLLNDEHEISFQKSDIQPFLIAALIHDLAEAVVGDIPLPDKTNEHEEEEKQVFRVLIKDLLDKKENSDCPVHICSVTQERVINILFGEDRLSKLFHMVEVSAYLTDAKRAWQSRKKSDSKQQREKLVAMAHDSFTNNAKHLSKVEEYPFLEIFFQSQTPQFINIIHSLANKENKNQKETEAVLIWTHFVITKFLQSPDTILTGELLRDHQLLYNHFLSNYGALTESDSMRFASKYREVIESASHFIFDIAV